MADGGASREVFTIQRIAEALKISKRGAEMRANRDGWSYTEQTMRGGRQRMYALTTLPADVQAALLLATRSAVDSSGLQTAPERRSNARLTDAQIRAAWQRYEAVPQHLKDAAARRLKALQAVERLVAEGHRLLDARAHVAAQLQREGVRGGSVPSLGRWAADVACAEKQHRLALLVPDYVGRTAAVEIPAEAWDTFKADYLRLEAPSAAGCYERLQRIAKVRGWQLPSLRSFERKISRELSPQVLVLARQGS